MGDVGYLEPAPPNDPRGQRFWFCGRKSHRVITAAGTLFTIPCEAIFNQHASIYRSALVGVGPCGQQRPAIIAEPWPEKRPRAKTGEQLLLNELHDLGKRNPLTAGIHDFFLRESLPVDIRHNAKIFREQLAVWAEQKIGNLSK